MRRLGGWQRLWVVASVFWTLILGAGVVGFFPDHVKHDDRFYERLSPVAKDQLATLSDPPKHPAMPEKTLAKQREAALDTAQARLQQGTGEGAPAAGKWTLEEIGRALRNAEAAGNTEDAKRLAEFYKLESAKVPDWAKSPILVKMKNGHELLLRGEIKLTQSTAVLKEYEEILRSELTIARVKLIGTMALIWIGGSVGLYVLGWTIGWVYRGFESGP